MKEGIYDEALKGVGEVIEQVSNELANEFKDKKPFDKEPISNDFLIFVSENMSSAMSGDLPDENDPSYVGDMEYIIEKYGAEAVNQRLFEISELRKRRKL